MFVLFYRVVAQRREENLVHQGGHQQRTHGSFVSGHGKNVYYVSRAFERRYFQCAESLIRTNAFLKSMVYIFRLIGWIRPADDDVIHP